MTMTMKYSSKFYCSNASKIDILLDEINGVNRKLLNKGGKILLRDVGLAICWYNKIHKGILLKYINDEDDNRLDIYNNIYNNYKLDCPKYINNISLLNNGATTVSRLNNGKLKLEHYIPVLNWYFSIIIIELFHAIIKENIQLPETNEFINNILLEIYQESYCNDKVLLFDDIFWSDGNEKSINNYVKKYLRKNNMEEIYISIFDEMMHQYTNDFDAKFPDAEISEEKKILLGRDIYEYTMHKFDICF